jgi:hypothetical protein
MQVTLRPDGPHSDAYTAELADAFAETVRVLCRATRGQGLDDPTTVSAVMGRISSGVYGLAQLVGQLTAWLDSEIAAGRVVDELGSSPATVSRQLREHSGEAATHAARLAEQLDRAQQVISTLYRPSS